ncbi:MAG: sugar ABC transporter permease [Anaerolineae bacterium]
MSILPRRTQLTLRQREERDFYLCIAPWLIGFILFTGGPVVYSFVMSLTNWTGISTREWVGFQNYIQLFTVDPLFWTVVKNTLVYGFFSVLLGTALALGAALLMNQKVPGISILRAIYYLPSVTSGVAVAIVFAYMFNARGLVNYLLSLVGIQGPGWFSSQQWAMPGLIIVSLWGIGPNMLVLLAGLQGIPSHLYEAARIDGANLWQEFRHVTVPMLSPALFYVTVISMITSLQVFESVYILSSPTGSPGTLGGPGTALRVYVIDLYQNAFINLRMGYASAQAWILCVIIMLLTWVMLRISKRRVYYEGVE